MKDYAVIIQVPGNGLAQNVEVVSAEGRDLEGEAVEVARAALLRAAEEAGGTPMLSDGDAYLDQEGPGGDLNLAVGILVTAFAAAGFPVRVVQIDKCERCDGDGSDIPGPCPDCNNRGVVEYERPPKPMGDA